jgi:uncharacterized protein (TIGR03000 family)
VHATPVQTVVLGTSATYESPVIESTYQPYAPMGETIIGERTITPSESGSSGATESTSSEVKGTDSVRNGSSVEADAAMLTVLVPADAKVTVNDHPTSSGGALRQFKSKGLKDGFVYTYVVKATFQVNGSETTETKSIQLRPGDVERVEFSAPVAQVKVAEPENIVVTVVKLHVPATAQVELAGNPTKGSGSERTFRTRQLKSGQKWAGYTIRVTNVVNGQPVSKERTIDVTAGSVNELTFEFDSASVARR